MSKKSLQKTVANEVSDLTDDLSGRWKDVVENARDWSDEAAVVIKKNPVWCVAGAFLVGFALSKVARYA